MNSSDDFLGPLARLGFSEMEASIYLDLLKHPGSTGYRIGKSINKPHANVYQGLGALEQKGAVLVEEGESRLYSAVAPDEMLGHLRARYEEKCREAESALKVLEVKAPDEDRFFRLTTRDQVYARARAMLRDVEETVLIEAFPGCARELREDLKRTLGRGIVIAGMVLDEADLIEGSRVTVSKMAERLRRVWPGDQLTLIIDAREFLLALFDRETGEVKRAIWVSSPYVATILNNGVIADAVLHDLPQIEEIGSLNTYMFGHLPPGCRELLEADGKPNTAPAMADGVRSVA